MFRLYFTSCFVLAGASAWGQENNKDLQDQVDRLEDKLEALQKKQAAMVSANPATALNPTLTVIGNHLLRLDSKKVFVDGDPLEPRIDDTFNIREAELDLRAAIDPHADAVAILAIESESPGDFAITIEECYAVIKKLPFWETPPLGTQIQLGKMRVDFGRLNKVHLHDLPQSNYGLVINDFLGPEGYGAVGIASKSFLGSIGETGVLQFGLAAFQAGGIEVAPADRRGAYLGSLQAFVQLSDASSIDAGIYLHYGTGARTLSLDILYKWKPLKQGEWSSFIVAAQVFHSDRSFPGIDAEPLGYLVWAQYQLDRRGYVGLRFDQSDFIDDDTMSHSRITPYVSYYLSEFFRLRASGEVTTSDDPAEDELKTFLFEVNIIFGSHPAEPFWVNK